ncbi:MAG: Rne/Rng family ribonuclease [Deltaproteobacteria bacterium]|nr:Rne/Rng family ribonuclease [Deltaproteobacteria bacterium]MBW2123048.1 Rne/Rng family ribonuclease [Deltaproteobacteria bacterium]
MTAELIINASPHENRVALLEEGTVVEIQIERKKERSIIGNTYRGRVVKVLPGMQAAFVDIGLDRAAFLYVTDVYSNIQEYHQMLEGGWEEHDGFEFEAGGSLFDGPPQIEDLVCEGQELLVQVSREPLGTKGTRVTAHISLPGRYLVVMPTVDHVGVSRRIADQEERRRLRDLVLGIRPPGFGVIVRTASEGAREEELKNDMDLLVRIWETIQRKNETAAAPSLIHSDFSLVLRAIRDLVTADVRRIVTDSEEEYGKIIKFMETYMPRTRCEVELYREHTPIFDVYGIEPELDRALRRKVWLKSGGYIVIEITEALTAIDVNTGKFVGKRNLENTIVKTNLEAAKEIAYQLRLRNIGGIIIIDFIDMEKETNRDMVYNALELALKKDRARSNISKISELGLVEMTRKRTRESLTHLLGEPCSVCDGLGYVKSKATVCYDIFRQIERVSSDAWGKAIVVNASPEVAEMLSDEERAGIERLEKKLGKRIVVQGIDRFHQEEFEVLEV